MSNPVLLLSCDFSDFAIGPFPYDPDHSAMGEYHYYPPKGYRGIWYDPITGSSFRGPSWLITEEDGHKYMEQMRVGSPGPHISCPTLVAGDKDWTDYTVSVRMRSLYTQEPAGILFRYQTSLMHYAFYLCDQKPSCIGLKRMFGPCWRKRILLLMQTPSIPCKRRYRPIKSISA